MGTFLLVHGAWHGGWCWKKVIPLLRGVGHEVFAPTLTGLGERSHLLDPEIDLTTHVRDVVGVLEYEDLHGVVLVGHSYGGIVITAVADQVASRLAHLVYLDAFVPDDGQSLFDLLSPDARARRQEDARTMGDGWRVPSFPLASWGVTEDADVRWMSPRMGPQPLKTFTQVGATKKFWDTRTHPHLHLMHQRASPAHRRNLDESARRPWLALPRTGNGP